MLYSHDTTFRRELKGLRLANGKTHQGGYIFGLGALAVCGWFLAHEGYLTSEEGVSLVAGGVIGMLIDPDVRDQHNITTRGERRMWGLPIFGPIIGYIFQVYWYPFALWIPHRSFLSHLPVVATALAAAWLLLPPALAFYYIGGYNASTSFGQWLGNAYQPWMEAAFWGWCVQDTIHLALDGFRFTWHVFGRSSQGKAY